jgi:putative ABC transport system permease protein
MRQINLAIGLAFADYLSEWRLSLCLIAGLAAVLGPLLVLFGLKFGMVNAMSRQLSRLPTSREVRPVGDGTFPAAFLDELSRQPGVGFVTGMPRYLTSSVRLDGAGGATLVADLWPTHAGDPVLEGSPIPKGVNQIVLSAGSARLLNAKAGDVIVAEIGRKTVGGQEQVERAALKVVFVLGPDAAPAGFAYCDLAFSRAVEAYREDPDLANFAAAVAKPAAKASSFASFRLYARDIHQVGAVVDWLRARNIETETHLSEIRLLERLDRGLSLLFAVIAGLGAGGYLIALAASLWASAERKRRELSILRLMGFGGAAVASFPVVQALLSAVLGFALATAIYAGTTQTIAAALNGTGSIRIEAVLLPEHFLTALAITILGALAASLLAGVTVLRISPTEGLRYD